MQIFSWFFRIISFYQHFFTLNILFNEVYRGLGHGNKHFVRYHLKFYRLLKLMTCSYSYREQILYRKQWIRLKKMIGCQIKTVGFLLPAKE